jgi:hypothetical protein
VRWKLELKGGQVGNIMVMFWNLRMLSGVPAYDFSSVIVDLLLENMQGSWMICLDLGESRLGMDELCYSPTRN